MNPFFQQKLNTVRWYLWVRLSISGGFYIDDSEKSEQLDTIHRLQNELSDLKELLRESREENSKLRSVKTVKFRNVQSTEKITKYGKPWGKKKQKTEIVKKNPEKVNLWQLKNALAFVYPNSEVYDDSRVFLSIDGHIMVVEKCDLGYMFSLASICRWWLTLNGKKTSLLGKSRSKNSKKVVDAHKAGLEKMRNDMKLRNGSEEDG